MTLRHIVSHGDFTQEVVDYTTLDTINKNQEFAFSNDEIPQQKLQLREPKI